MQPFQNYKYFVLMPFARSSQATHHSRRMKHGTIFLDGSNDRTVNDKTKIDVKKWTIENNNTVTILTTLQTWHDAYVKFIWNINYDEMLSFFFHFIL